MTSLNKNVLFITSMILLLIFIQASAVTAQAPQPFNTDEDTGFYYTIQKGDTLWDLSQKFYNSQWDWPGLWEINKDIKNPHWIYPGNKIRVYLKSDQVKQSQQPPLDPTTPLPAPVVPQFNYPVIDRIGFIKASQENVLGTIIREKDGNLMMSASDIIYIKPTSDGALIPGERYQIFTTEPVEQKINGVAFKGIKHLIKSDIKVLEIHDSYIKAVIEKAYRDATVGDKIMEYKRRVPMLTIQDNPAPADAVILCSEDNELMVNDGRIAFINKGENDNIRPGQIYTIRQVQEKLSRHDSDDVALLSPLDSGRLIVLHTEAISATVMVLSSARDIHPGDQVN